MNNLNDELDEALGQLRTQHRSVNAPPSIERKLRSAVRVRRSSRLLSYWSPAVAAAVIAILVSQASRPPDHPVPVIRENFVALPMSDSLPPATATSVLSVQLPKGELRQYGLEVPPPLVADLVRVELMIGEDGLARAIRFIP
jgi:hypothetical protein